MAAESQSIVQICNMALTQLGEPSITSLAEQSKAARLCDLRFSDIRDAVLRAHPWNSATKRVELAQLAASPAYGWSFAYQLPADWLRMVSPRHRETPYVIEGRELLANIQQFQCKYIYRVSDVTLLDSLCQATIAARLAAELCLPLARSAERQANLWAQYNEKLSEARFIDGSEQASDQLQTDDWLRSRFDSTLEPYRPISSG